MAINPNIGRPDYVAPAQPPRNRMFSWSKADTPRPQAADPHYLEAAKDTAFALKNPDSNAAKRLGLAQHDLDEKEQKEVADTVGRAATMRPKENFFSMLMEMIMNLFRSDEEKTKNAAEKVEATATQVAATTYRALKAKGYDELAESVSGMKPDDKGVLHPIKDNDGRGTGVYQRERDKGNDPMMARINDAVDKGMAPSQKQSQIKAQLVEEGAKRLYTDPALRNEIDEYRENRKQTRGKDNEVDTFFAKPEVKRIISEMADKVASDQNIKDSGRFRFDRAKEEKFITAGLKAAHKQNFSKYEGEAPPAPSFGDLLSGEKIVGRFTATPSDFSTKAPMQTAATQPLQPASLGK